MSLKLLSDRLKLSQTTVSRALNGYPEVSEKTRQRVQAAARAMNYSPNAGARSLATGQAMAIGHVIPVTSRHEMVNPIFGDFIAGAGETYAQAGYEMNLSIVEDREEKELYRDIKARGSVDGVIVHSPQMADERIALLNELDLPFVVHGRASDCTQPYSWVDVNNNRSFQRATDFLIDLGHRRIALINGPEIMDFAHRRRQGFFASLNARGIEAVPDLLRSDDMTEVYGYRSTQELLQIAAPPTAFLVSSMITAIGVRRALDAAGLVLGRDVSVITHDDDLSYLKNGDSVPIFTATRSSVRFAGRRAAKMLLQLIAQPDRGPLTELLEADLIVGRSTGPALE